MTGEQCSPHHITDRDDIYFSTGILWRYLYYLSNPTYHHFHLLPTRSDHLINFFSILLAVPGLGLCISNQKWGKSGSTPQRAQYLVESGERTAPSNKRKMRIICLFFSVFYFYISSRHDTPLVILITAPPWLFTETFIARDLLGRGWRSCISLTISSGVYDLLADLPFFVSRADGIRYEVWPSYGKTGWDGWC